MTSTPTFSQDIPVPDDVIKAATEFQNMVDRDPKAYAAFDVAVLAIMADRQRVNQSRAMDKLIADSADEIMPWEDRRRDQWQDISSAPKDGTEILVCDRQVSGGFMNVVSYTAEDYPNVWETQEFLAYHEDAFTHWMPLPPAPSMQGEG
jgi:hypothetical protein